MAELYALKGYVEPDKVVAQEELTERQKTDLVAIAKQTLGTEALEKRKFIHKLVHAAGRAETPIRINAAQANEIIQKMKEDKEFEPGFGCVKEKEKIIEELP